MNVIDIREIWMEMENDRFNDRFSWERLKREDDEKKNDTKNSDKLECVKDNF
jgi:hypothetical protein